MPQIGEKRRGREIGIKSSNAFIWQACSDCGKERWVRITRGKPRNYSCHACNGRRCGEKNSYWKGGRYKDIQGYPLIKLSPGDFFYSMAWPNGYVSEHRLVMAKHLGRCLHSWEIVHHKNHIKVDNSLENLQLVSDMGHKQISLFEKRIRLLEQRVLLLETENMLLKARIHNA